MKIVINKLFFIYNKSGKWYIILTLKKSKNMTMKKHDSYRLLIVCFLLPLLSSAQFTDTIKVNVDGHKIMLYISGSGKATIVLEAGGSSNHTCWKKIEPEIAKFAKVVSYDRPGYLQSAPCSKPGDADRVAKELKEALTKANIQPPYILTGWSLGGAFVRVFAGLYPKDVAGILLIDPTPEEFYDRAFKEYPEIMKDDSAYMHEILASNRIGERDEMKVFDTSINQAKLSDTLHSTPTILLIADRSKPDNQNPSPGEDPVNKIWIEELQKWAVKQRQLSYEIVASSGHHIANDRPDAVLKALHTLIAKEK